jgi:hypothetical protein
MRVSTRAVLAGLLIAPFCSIAQAQNWPTRPMTMVVPFAAGSGSDVIARIFAKRLSELLGGQVIVENIGGAGGMTAAKCRNSLSQLIMLDRTGSRDRRCVARRRPLSGRNHDVPPVFCATRALAPLQARAKASFHRRQIPHRALEMAARTKGERGINEI